MDSVDVDSEMDEIIKEAQETNLEDEDTSDTGTTNAQISSSGGSSNLIEAITLLQKDLAVHGAGGSGQANTTVISSKPDTNTGSTYDEYLSKISQDLEKCEERGPPLNENITNFFKTLYTMT